MDRDLLHDAGIEQRMKLAAPARWLSHDDQVVGAKLVLVEDAGCRVWRGLQLEHHGAALFGVELHLVVAQRVAP
jgi:hypothetical protein